MALYPSLSPGLVGPESERLLLLGAENVSALVLVSRDDNDLEVWSGCGADFFLLRRFKFQEDDILLWCADSGSDPTRLRVRMGGDGTGYLSVIDWDSTGVGVTVLPEAQVQKGP